MTSKTLLAAFLATVAIAPVPVRALGFRITDHDALATARGGAFAATADNPSAVFYNPAGITQLHGLNAQLGVYAVRIETGFTSSIDGRSFDSSDDVQAVPNFFATWRAKNSPISFGLGTYAPYGLGVEYPDDVPFRTIAKEGAIRYFTINPVIAVEVTRTFSVAIGATLNAADVSLERGILAAGDRFRFEGTGQAIGFNAGLLWKPTEQHAFGIKYHSPTSIDFSGHSSVKTKPFTVPTPAGPFQVPGQNFEEDSDADVDFPQFVVLGYSFRPAPDWNFEVNIDWADWDQLETVTLRGQQTGRSALPFNYTSSFLYEFGITKKFSRGLRASAGYIFSENSVPESEFNPVNPDSDRHVFSAGLGQQTDRWHWDIAYQFAYGVERHIEQGTTADGDYQTIAHAITLSAGLQF